MVGLALVVHAATVVLQAVGDDEVVDMEQQVVGGNLGEHPLRQGNVGGLVLDDHQGAHVRAVDKGVAAQRLLATPQRDLVGQQALGVALVVDQEMGEVLAHPLFGRQGHVAATQKVENLRHFARTSNIHLICRQIQLFHSGMQNYENIL